MAGILDQSNTGSVSDGNGIRFQSSNGNFKAAVQFQPTISGNLSEVHFLVGLLSGHTNPGGNMFAELYSDTGSNVPNAQIGNVSNSVATSTVTTVFTTGQEVTFTWDEGSRPVLTAGTKYWLVFDGDWAFNSVDQLVFCEVSNSSLTTVKLLQDGGSWSNGGATSWGWFKEFVVVDVTTQTSYSFFM